MKFSYVMLPDYPLADSLASIQLADELGFYAVYAADETWHKDLWLLFAAAADKTSNIRMGPSVSGVVLREPSLIAQATATLDELTGGRAEVVLSSGNFGLLAQYGMDWSTQKPLSRVKEGVHVLRTLLDEGAITFDGEFFTYQGLFTFARPVQQHVPVKMGAMRGPRSFQVAAEISDGCHHALSYTREAYEYMVENMTIGAERAGKDVADLDIGAWVVFATGEDSAVAKDAARSMVGLYASSMPDEQLLRNGVDPADMKPILVRARRRRPGRQHRRHHAEDRRHPVDLRHPRGVRGQAEGDRGGRREPHDPGHHRRDPGQDLHGPRHRGRGRRGHPAPPDRRQDHARVRLTICGHDVCLRSTVRRAVRGSSRASTGSKRVETFSR